MRPASGGYEETSKPIPLNKSYQIITSSNSTIKALEQDVKSV